MKRRAAVSQSKQAGAGPLAYDDRNGSREMFFQLCLDDHCITDEFIAPVSDELTHHLHMRLLARLQRA
jgi:hypothetical protein